MNTNETTYRTFTEIAEQDYKLMASEIAWVAASLPAHLRGELRDLESRVQANQICQALVKQRS